MNDCRLERAMNVQHNAAVVLIVYKAELTSLERVSVIRCLDIMNRHPIIVVAPEGLSLPIEVSGLKTEYFPVNWFASIRLIAHSCFRRYFYERFFKI